MVQPKSRSRDPDPRVEGASADPIPVIPESGAAEPDEVRLGVDDLAEVRRPVAEATVAGRIPPDRLNWKGKREMFCFVLFCFVSTFATKIVALNW